MTVCPRAALRVLYLLAYTYLSMLGSGCLLTHFLSVVIVCDSYADGCRYVYC